VAFIIVVFRYIFGYHLRYLTNLVVTVIGAGMVSLILTSLFIGKTITYKGTVHH